MKFALAVAISILVVLGVIAFGNPFSSTKNSDTKNTPQDPSLFPYPQNIDPTAPKIPPRDQKPGESNTEPSERWEEAMFPIMPIIRFPMIKRIFTPSTSFFAFPDLDMADSLNQAQELRRTLVKQGDLKKKQPAYEQFYRSVVSSVVDGKEVVEDLRSYTIDDQTIQKQIRTVPEAPEHVRVSLRDERGKEKVIEDNLSKDEKQRKSFEEKWKRLVEGGKVESRQQELGYGEKGKPVDSQTLQVERDKINREIEDLNARLKSMDEELSKSTAKETSSGGSAKMEEDRDKKEEDRDKKEEDRAQAKL